jgi:hypothetical protein
MEIVKRSVFAEDESWEGVGVNKESKRIFLDQWNYSV